MWNTGQRAATSPFVNPTARPDTSRDPSTPPRPKTMPPRLWKMLVALTLSGTTFAAEKHGASPRPRRRLASEGGDCPAGETELRMDIYNGRVRDADPNFFYGESDASPPASRNKASPLPPRDVGARRGRRVGGLPVARHGPERHGARGEAGRRDRPLPRNAGETLHPETRR